MAPNFVGETKYTAGMFEAEGIGHIDIIGMFVDFTSRLNV